MVNFRQSGLLGFRWDDVLSYSVEPVTMAKALAYYRQKFPHFIWNASKLENNPFNFIEIKTLLNGITVGGYKLSDSEQITNLIDSNRALIEEVVKEKFDLNKKTILYLHHIVARNEALEWGTFRGEGNEKQNSQTPFVDLGEQGIYIAPRNTSNLNGLFHEGVVEIKTLPPYEGALVMFLFCVLQKFFFAGNKRIAFHMMNGWLIKHGFYPITIPASSINDFNDKLNQFYLTKDGTEMLTFLSSCYKRE